MLKPIKLVAGLLRERKKNKSRSPEWSKLRKQHLAVEGACAACGGTSLLQVHHIDPVHLAPEKELDPTNLITLCIRNLCHLEVGHGSDYKFYNDWVVRDSQDVLANPQLRKLIVMNAKANRKSSA